MALRYYDDAIRFKISRWFPEQSNLRILKSDETKRFFELMADDTKDQAFRLPFITLSRDSDVTLISNIKQLRSYNGLTIQSGQERSQKLNIIPITVNYKLDIYTKTVDEGDEYLRSFLFKLINNPTIKIEVPYNNTHFEHIANLRVGNTVSDTSSISERLFSGQFQRWTIMLELQDGFLFNTPYIENWKLINVDDDIEILTLQKDGTYTYMRDGKIGTANINKHILYAGLELTQNLSAPIDPSLTELP